MNAAIKQTESSLNRSSDLPTILVVDDEPTNISVLAAILKPQYRVRAARSGPEALRAISSMPTPDLVLLDIMMPDMDGYAVLQALRQQNISKTIPVIFVTAMNSLENEAEGLEHGAVDYITKPVTAPILLARVSTQLELKAMRDHLAQANNLLELQVAQRTQALRQALEQNETAHAALKKTYFSTLLAINSMAELRGGGIGEHSRRVADLARQVARKMDLSDDEVQDVFIAALLHDIGKVSFPDSLFNKSLNTLNSSELSIYRRHSVQGANIVRQIKSLNHIAEMIQDHHEYFDGTGFPAGKSGLNIPLGARIIAAVSDYDDFRTGALTTRPMNARDCHGYFLENRGRRYDPCVIDCLEPYIAQDSATEIDEVRISAKYLQEGMLLSKDVMHPDGFLLLSKSTLLNRTLIDQLVLVEKQAATTLSIYVIKERPTRTSHKGNESTSTAVKRG
ncbi:MULTISPECIES: HD domain-containing phosphohydrolase [Deefgea]|uniref:Response regulator n=1 Tax=Deefgea chitinilytica TaxID=570276 RepID=A0ABS2CCQ7_9NEIS|nr:MULTISPECIES: HD domain-containing phosphohydrolase [Deefgea]MBM5571238.1 response regulator [Deefgea chitinilytica]MBM9888470.1 response regulator [Deefgea sp. CFH1-16]